MKSMVLAVLAVLASGCAVQPQLSREEFLALTTRDYPGVTAEQAIAAAERVFRLADGDDFAIAHREDGFSATRDWMAYLVITFVSGTDTWDLRARPIADGTRLTLSSASVSAATNAMIVAPGIAVPYSGPATGKVITTPALYELFWARLDWMLGRRETWIDCPSVGEFVAAHKLWGDITPLCNSFNVKDLRPTAADRVVKAR
jgi:hypothetical protein